MSAADRRIHWLLRRADQLAVALLTGAALAAMAVWWIIHGGGKLIEIDRADPLTAGFQVDINTADWPELIQVPGIGQALARRIVETRRTTGPFNDHDDLRRVHGIGAKTLEQIRPYLRPMAGNSEMAAK